MLVNGFRSGSLVGLLVGSRVYYLTLVNVIRGASFVGLLVGLPVLFLHSLQVPAAAGSSDYSSDCVSLPLHSSMALKMVCALQCSFYSVSGHLSLPLVNRYSFRSRSAMLVNGFQDGLHSRIVEFLYVFQISFTCRQLCHQLVVPIVCRYQ